MEATTTTTRKRKSLAARIAIGLAPLLLLLVMGGVWAGWRIAESARDGSLDLNLGGFFVKVDRNGPANAPRRLSLGFRLGTATTTTTAAKPANVPL